MAEQQFDPEVLKNQKAVNDAGSEYLGIQKEILAAMKKMAGYNEKSAAEQRKLNRTQSEGSKLARMLEKFNTSDLKNAKKREAFQNAYNNFKSRELDIQEQIKELFEEGSDKSKKIAQNLKDSSNNMKNLAEDAKAVADNITKANKITGLFKNFESMVKDIPVLSKIFHEFTTASEKGVEAFAETGSSIDGIVAGFGQIGAGLGKLTLSGLFGSLLEGLLATEQATIGISRQMGLGASASMGFKNQLEGLADGYFVIGDLTESALAFSQAMGSGVPPSAETVRYVTLLSKRLGISAEQSAELYRLSALSGKSFKDVADNIVATTKGLNASGDVTLNYRDILQDVAGASAANLLTTEKFPGGIAKAAFEARKLGLSFDTLEGASSNMLDFESSIAAELEAELLTGKQLNLQKAREAALMGDQATFAAEINKQGINATSFGAMNVLQQEATAKALGLSREELSKSLVQQKALLELEKDTGVAGLSRMETQEKIKALEATGMSTVEALNAIGEEELAMQASQKTASEALKGALKEVGNELSKLLQVITGEGNPLSAIAEGLTTVAKFIGGGDEINRGGGVGKNITGVAGGTMGGYLGMKMAGTLGLGKKYGTKIMKKGGGKMLGKIGGGIFSKAIPGLALGMALTDLLQGDYTGAALNTAAGIASFFPGVGTAIAGGLGALDLARETLGDGADPLGDVINAEDFTIRTHPKDTLAMAGGTQFGKETNDLLRELVREVKASGNTYLDSRKISEVMRLNAYEQ